MTYKVFFTNEALDHLEFWRKSGQKKILEKIALFVEELKEHPTTGTGQVERLKRNLSGLWSRRIDKQNRLVYSIEDDIVTVTIYSAKGQYGDK